MVDYPRGDPRTDKTLYMYYPFGGLDFLERYRNGRHSTLAQMKAVLQRETNPSYPAYTILRWRDGEGGIHRPVQTLAVPGTCPFDIEEVLVQCMYLALSRLSYQCLMEAEIQWGPHSKVVHEPSVIDSWCEVIIRKIEVAKTLVVRYDARLKRSSVQPVGLDEYALSALIIAMRLGYLNPHRGLNALLKINDILAHEASGGTTFSSTTAAAGLVAYELELHAAQQLARQHGLTWGDC